MKKQFEYECPLLKKTIDDSFCLEINYEHLELFKTEILKEYAIRRNKQKKYVQNVSFILFKIQMKSIELGR